MSKHILDAKDWNEMYEMLLLLTYPLIEAASKQSKAVKDKEDQIAITMSLELLLSYFRARVQAPCQQDQELFQARVNHNFETLSKELRNELEKQMGVKE